MAVIFGKAPTPTTPTFHTISTIDVRPELLAEVFRTVLPLMPGHIEPLILLLMINGK